MKTPKAIKGYMIHNKDCSTPWTMEVFHTKEGARKGFYEHCKRGGLNFPFASFEVYSVLITPITKKKV